MAEVDDRIIARRRAVRETERQRRLRRTLTLLGVLAAIALLVVLERSPLVALDRVDVTGVVALSQDAVRAAADLDLGTSTVRLRLAEAEANVESLPRVAQATVRRQDPISVIIEVVERVPAYIVVTGDRRLLLDDQGVVIALAAGERLPVIDMTDDTPIGVGMTAAAVPALSAAVAVLSELPGPVRVRVSLVESSRSDGVALELDDGVRVRVGDRNRIPEKARALAAVLEDLDGRTVAIIDVRAPTAPVVVPVSDATASPEPTASPDPTATASEDP